MIGIETENIFSPRLPCRLAGSLRLRLRTAYRTTSVLILFLLAGLTVQSPPRVFLIGDSTMADKPLIGNPERGWGQVFPLFFQANIMIENHARNGRSTKSFIAEGRWNTVLERLQPGDYVMIQFGHNDAKKEDSTRYAEAHTDYKANLLAFVRDARAKNANPILLTPVVRRRFNAKGEFYDVHGDYPGVVREVAAMENVPLLDVHKRSMELLTQLGAEESNALFLRASPGEFSAIPNGKKDDTHFTWRGASQIASLVVEELRKIQSPLASYLLPESPPPFVGIQKTVLLDCYFNNEWRTDSTGKSVRFHYVWHDSTNSGFSMLGKIISNTGATIDTLCQRPTQQRLHHANIYILVDPDTPKENPNPNYINQESITVISEWVSNGGVLILFGNDKGNAEFEHLNSLAERFGIHFNEDSRNRVTGTQFELGTFEKFPSHPLFKNVRKIFIKELSTLRIQSPAESVLTDNGDVIMACAKFGKGLVFAVGDPWLYNEYMGTWRLPDGYDNAKAANNLFSWLLNYTNKSIH
jgi:lysophospholipase L1-like esterase